MTRRRALVLFAMALASSSAAACLPSVHAQDGNRIVPLPTPTLAQDERLIPRNWKETRVRVGSNVNRLTALHFIPDLQLPQADIPYIQSMTFFAPAEVPLVSIGLYYEKNDQNGLAKNILTGPTFGLQHITELDTQFRFDTNALMTLQTERVTQEQLGWFEQHRQSIIDAMKSSAEGSMLGKTWDCNFTTRARPPTNTPAALVITQDGYSGLETPFTVVAQRIVFVD